MSKLNLGVFAHPSKRLYLGKKNGSKRFYREVCRLLDRWNTYGVSDKDEASWVYKVLYEPFDPSPVNHEIRLKKNLTTIRNIIDCKSNSCCRRQSYCIDCLANWRYSKAKAILQARKENRNLRLLLRKETFLVPRGVCFDGLDSQDLVFMQNNIFNPIYQMPSSNKRFVMEPESYDAYKRDPFEASEAYDNMTARMWSRIGGLDVMFMPMDMDYYNNEPSEEKREKTAKSIIDGHNRLKDVMRRNISDPQNNPLIPELLIHASIMSRRIKDTEGYIHRITMYPSYHNACVVVIQLDTLFLATKDVYERLKESDEYWKSNRRYRHVPLEGRFTYLKYYCTRTLTACKKIPTDIHKLLEIMEVRFPFIGNRYARFLPTEFLFYMNCMSQYRLTRSAGVFSESECHT